MERIVSRVRVAAEIAVSFVLVTALLAVAAADDASILPGKRVERRDGRVVTTEPDDDEPAPSPDDDEPAPSPDDDEPAPSPTTAPSPTDSSPPSPSPPATAAPLPSTPPLPSGPCSGVAVTAGSDLQSALDAHPAGTTFCLGAGTFTVAAPITPESGDSIVGLGASQTFVVASGAPAVFEATGTTGVTLRDLDISGAVGGESCKPACGRGISGGSDLLVANVRVHDNAAAGIGGTDGPMTIVASELDHNGSEALRGCCAAGVKSANGFTITDSSVHDNIGVGIWCDVGCGGTFQAVDNVVSGNQLGGIRYETASGPALIQGNVVTNNNVLSQGGHGGIEVNSSANVVVTANTLGGNSGAGIIVGGGRSPGLENVMISNNSLSGDELVGCDQGVTCLGNV
jgi:hypothetical protein